MSNWQENAEVELRRRAEEQSFREQAEIQRRSGRQREIEAMLQHARGMFDELAIVEKLEDIRREFWGNKGKIIAQGPTSKWSDDFKNYISLLATAPDVKVETEGITKKVKGSYETYSSHGGPDGSYTVSHEHSGWHDVMVGLKIIGMRDTSFTMHFDVNQEYEGLEHNGRLYGKGRIWTSSNDRYIDFIEPNPDMVSITQEVDIRLLDAKGMGATLALYEKQEKDRKTLIRANMGRTVSDYNALNNLFPW